MRLIDADAFERAVMFSDDEDIQDVIYRLRDFPTADVVEVVRCKDCTRQLICYHSDDYYCADGERREDDKERSDFRVDKD